MKAQTFLEWFAGYIENHALTNDGDLTNTALTFHKLKDFYSQPFKPEIITELFEGWNGDNCGNFNSVCGWVLTQHKENDGR